jgi:exodeoxyribonuclease VII large subunit
MGRALDIKRERMRVAAASLDALSPLRVLGRGYSIARAADGSLLRSSEQVRVGDEIEVTLAEGALRATVGACGESKGNR